VTDPRKLKPSELCRLLNSTPLGEVVVEGTIRRHRSAAGMRIGDSKHVDLIRYAAWLFHQRHTPKPKNELPVVDVAEAAEGAAALCSQRQDAALTSKQEAAIAAMLSERTYTAAAAKVGVGKATLYRWLKLPNFRSAYHDARTEMTDFTIGRIQAASCQAVETLLGVMRQGRRDGDRVRAAIATFDIAFRGLAEADLLHGLDDVGAGTSMSPADVVARLSARLRAIEQSSLSTADKARLTVTLSDALLRAFGVDVLDKRLEALQDVLLSRKDK
jgi:hypothetical protein